DNYSAEVPLKVGGSVVRSPDTMPAEIDLIPKLDDLVDRRQAEHHHGSEECSEFERQSIAEVLQHAASQPNDDRADEHLHRRVCKLVVLHWPKLPAIHVKEVSECVDLQCEKDERQECQRDLNVETNANVCIKHCQEDNDEDRVEGERQITHLQKEGCARDE